MARSQSHSVIESGWFWKALAGLVLGFLLAVGFSKLFVLVASGMAPTARVQLAMWLVMPVWLTAFAFSFAFRKSFHSWLLLSCLNLLVFGLAEL